MGRTAPALPPLQKLRALPPHLCSPVAHAPETTARTAPHPPMCPDCQPGQTCTIRIILLMYDSELCMALLCLSLLARPFDTLPTSYVDISTGVCLSPGILCKLVRYAAHHFTIGAWAASLPYQILDPRRYSLNPKPKTPKPKTLFLATLPQGGQGQRRGGDEVCC